MIDHFVSSALQIAFQLLRQQSKYQFSITRPWKFQQRTLVVRRRAPGRALDKRTRGHASSINLSSMTNWYESLRAFKTINFPNPRWARYNVVWWVMVVWLIPLPSPHRWYTLIPLLICHVTLLNAVFCIHSYKHYSAYCPRPRFIVLIQLNNTDPAGWVTSIMCCWVLILSAAFLRTVRLSQRVLKVWASTTYDEQVSANYEWKYRTICKFRFTTFF